MCGIVGILHPRFDTDTTRSRIISMAALCKHRGPDEWGIFVSPHCALGHTRLSIVGLSDGQQPMTDGRYVISYNGEVYNYLELRDELKSLGRVFRTGSDTEVVLQAFDQWGVESLRRFNGQFAAVVWDKKTKRLTCFRDRYGVRPLFVLRHQGSYYFASETKSFDAIPDYQRRFSPQHLLEHGLLWNTIGNETVFEGIETVASASYLVFEPGRSPVGGTYYTLGESSSPPPSSFDEAQTQLVDLLEDSVRLRLRSEVPVGAYLSGGVDSSVITKLTHNITREPFRTFSIGFADSSFDESSYQDEMVKCIGSDHSPLVVDYRDVETNFAETVYHCERPLFRTAPVPLFLLAQNVRKSNIRVVLTGEAADEILFGYDSFKELKLLEFWRRFPTSTMRPQLIRRLYPHLRHYADSQQYGLMRMYYEGFLDRVDNTLASLNIRIANNCILENYFNPDWGVAFSLPALNEKMRAQLPPQHAAWSLLQRNQFVEMQSLLAGYLLSSQGDRMSLAHGIEGRYPFLDHRVVEAVFSYPDSFKLRGFSQKHILRKAFEKAIPASIIDRPKLPYQAPDLKSFLQAGSYRETVNEYLSPEKVREYGIFDATMVSRFLRKHAVQQRDHVGYRDNMLLVFLLSTQIAHSWMVNKRNGVLDATKKTVELIEG